MASVCERRERAVRAADRRMWSLTVLTPEREAARKELERAQRALATCKRNNAPTRGVLLARGYARAAHAAGVRFALEPGFQKRVGLFGVDRAILRAFRVERMEDVVRAGKRLAERHGLAKATEYATTIEALRDTLAGATGGFVTAQVALVALDVVGTIFTLGAYAVAAPAVHAAVGAGQAVTTAMIERDIAANEKRYKAEIARVRAARKRDAPERPRREPGAPVQAPEPWYRSLWLWGGLLLAGAFALAPARA